MTQMNPDSFFGGAPTLSYPKANNGTYTDRALLGTVRGGRIVDEPALLQMTKMGTGEPEWWDPTTQQRPKMQLVVTLLCDGSGNPGPGIRALDERQSPQDDGKRRLYIRGKDMTDAVRNAFKAAGAEGLRVGSELYVVWTGERPSKMKGGDPARTWAARYVPGAVGIPAQSAAESNAFGGNMPPATWGNGPAQGQPVTTPNYNQPPPNGAPNPYAAAQQPQYVPGDAGFAVTGQQAPPDPWGSPSAPPAAQPPQQPFGGQPQAGPAGINPFG